MLVALCGKLQLQNSKSNASSSSTSLSIPCYQLKGDMLHRINATPTPFPDGNKDFRIQNNWKSKSIPIPTRSNSNLKRQTIKKYLGNELKNIFEWGILASSQINLVLRWRGWLYCKKMLKLEHTVRKRSPIYAR